MKINRLLFRSAQYLYIYRLCSSWSINDSKLINQKRISHSLTRIQYYETWSNNDNRERYTFRASGQWKNGGATIGLQVFRPQTWQQVHGNSLKASLILSTMDLTVQTNET